MADSVAPSAGDIYLFDIGDNGNASDIRLKFYEPVNNTNNNSYKIFVIASLDLPLSGSALLDTAPCIIVPPAGSGYLQTHTLPGSLLDVNGNAIIDGVSYQLIIQAVTSSGASNYVVSTDGLILAPETVHITILGEEVMTLYQNDPYTDAGATASDGSTVSVSYTLNGSPVGSINTAMIGTHKAKYDTQGANQAIRVVNVIERTKDFDYGFLLGTQLDGGTIEINGDYGVGEEIYLYNLSLVSSGVYTIIS